MYKSNGLTIIELLFAIAILTVILSLAIPGMESLRSFSQSTAATQQLMAVLNFARQQSVTHKISVSICPTQNNNNCSHNWRDPLMVFHDSNSSGLRDNGENILKYTDIRNDGEKLV